MGEPAKECLARFFNRTDIHPRGSRLQHHLLYLAPEFVPAVTVAVEKKRELKPKYYNSVIIIPPSIE